MREYYAGAGGGCFAQSATVRVAPRDGSGGDVVTRVADVRRGDAVRVAGGGVATVACVAEIERAAAAPLVALPNGGPTLTPGHPVRVDGAWRAARDVAGGSQVVTGAHARVYNFVLDSSHILLVDGVEAVTWAHGLADEGLAHAFFGTRRVLQDLARLDGWEDGHVRVRGVVREKGTDAIVGLLGNEPAIEPRTAARSGVPVLAH